VLVLAGLTAGLFAAHAADQTNKPADAQHPAEGTWLAKAVQVCGEPISACAKGAIMMTPTINADGVFIANDTLEFVPAPFGTHATAHGQWESTGAKSILADYMFLNPTVAQVVFPSTTATRLRWTSEVIEDGNTMVGYVNAYSTRTVATVWESLAPDQFPTVPQEGKEIANIPDKAVYKDPKDCTLYPQSACPLVFKFRVYRVTTR
jgi:hypothetical protein